MKRTLDPGIRYMLISVVGFSLMNLMVKSLSGLPATELVLFRSIVSLALSYAIIKKKKLPPFGVNKKFLLMRGVFGVTALTLYFYTLVRLPIGSASTIQYLSPIFTAFFAIYILKEPMRPIQWLFFFVSFLGIVFIKGFDPNITPTLLLMGIGSAVFSGLAYNAIRKVKDTDHPAVVVFYFPLIATPVMAVWSFFDWVTPTWEQVGLMVLMGVFTQVAQIYMTKAYQASEVNKIAPLKYVGILFALGFDVFLFDVIYSPWVLLGIGLVILGVLLNILHKSAFKE
ncbi:MAG: DMT family transporter [Schleiferiaceae bacterium]